MVPAGVNCVPVNAGAALVPAGVNGAPVPAGAKCVPAAVGGDTADAKSALVHEGVTLASGNRVLCPLPPHAALHVDDHLVCQAPAANRAAEADALPQRWVPTRTSRT